MRGMRVKCRGHGENSKLSSETGLTELYLPPGLTPGDEIEIELDSVTSSSQGWIFLQPFDGRFNVPSPKQRFYKINLVRRDHYEAMKRLAKSDITQRNVDVDKFDGLSPPFVKKN